MFRKFFRLEIASNRERAHAKLACDRSFRDTVLVCRSYRLEPLFPFLPSMLVYLFVLVEPGWGFRCNFVCYRHSVAIGTEGRLAWQRKRLEAFRYLNPS